MQKPKTLQQLLSTSPWNNTAAVAGTATLTNELPIIEDTTDEFCSRHLKIQTTVTGNNQDGYRYAERQAHEWFFVNYDNTARRFKKFMDHATLIEMFLES